MKTTKPALAKTVRVVTVPPVMVAALILILDAEDPTLFRSVWEKLLTLFFLGFVPVLAYPLQPLCPHFKGKGRAGQRALAFVMTGAGYTLALLGAWYARVERGLLFLLLGYFLSFVLLAVCNRFTPVRASGHASSIVGPMLYLVHFAGWRMLPPCLAVAGLVVWSSLSLKRHTVRELLSGAVCSVAAFLGAMVCMGTGLYT